MQLAPKTSNLGNCFLWWDLGTHAFLMHTRGVQHTHTRMERNTHKNRVQDTCSFTANPHPFKHTHIPLIMVGTRSVRILLAMSDDWRVRNKFHENTTVSVTGASTVWFKNTYCMRRGCVGTCVVLTCFCKKNTYAVIMNSM